jgi:hypothetical protein
MAPGIKTNLAQLTKRIFHATPLVAVVEALFRLERPAVHIRSRIVRD